MTRPISDKHRKALERNQPLAVAAHKRKAAERAVDDPAALARAARIVRVALERNRLTLADLTDDPGEAA